MGIRVGIDLGTTFSAVACIDEHTGMPKIIKIVWQCHYSSSVFRT